MNSLTKFHFGYVINEPSKQEAQKTDITMASFRWWLLCFYMAIIIAMDTSCLHGFKQYAPATKRNWKWSWEAGAHSIEQQMTACHEVSWIQAHRKQPKRVPFAGPFGRANDSSSKHPSQHPKHAKSRQGGETARPISYNKFATTDDRWWQPLGGLVTVTIWQKTY